MVKHFEDMFIRFDTIHERDRHTDTHRMTAQAALMHSIARQKNGMHIQLSLSLHFYLLYLLLN